MIIFAFKKGFKIAIIIFVLIVGIIALSYYIKPYIINKLSGAIHQNLPAGYELSYDSMGISMFPFGVIFENTILSVSDDDKANVEPFMVSRIKTFQISDINLWSYFFHDKLIIKQIEADGVDTKWIGFDKEEVEDEVQEEIETSLKLLQVETVKISNASFKYQRALPDTVPSFEVPIMNLVVQGVVYDSVFNRPDYYELEVLNPSYKQKSGLHSVAASKIFIASQDSSMTIDSLRLIPLIKAPQLEYFVEHETDIIDLVIPSARINNLDIMKWIDSEKIVAGGMVMESPRFDVYKDKTLPDKPKPPGLPSEMIGKIREWLYLDSLKINAGFIRYHELKNKEAGPGYITFENLDAIIKGISCPEESTKRATINASAKLMGKGLLQANIEFPQGFLSDTFSVKGSLGPMPLDQLNPMTTQVADVEILKGVTESITFSFRANKHFSTGNMHFHYSDLKLSFIDKENGKKGLLKTIISTIANMTVYNSNPRNKKFRVGEIHFVREEPKSIFNYWWKSLFSGIQSSVMVRNNKK